MINQSYREVLGEWLRASREEKGLTVYKVSLGGGIKHDQVKAIEAGDKNYTIDSFLGYLDGSGLRMKLEEKKSRKQAIAGIREYSLPEWAFLDACSHAGNELKRRTVILHIRSATVIEDFIEGEINLNPDAITHRFIYMNNFKIIENHIFALHYSATLKSNEPSIKEHVFMPAEQWYKEYLKWEDDKIAMDKILKLT